MADANQPDKPEKIRVAELPQLFRGAKLLFCTLKTEYRI